MKEGRREWQGKSLNDVDIRDDFMFSYIMRDPELCLGLLRQLLPDCPIERIEYVELEAEKQQLEKALGTRLETQKALFGAAGKRSVRLDAYLDDGKTICVATALAAVSGAYRRQPTGARAILR